MPWLSTFVRNLSHRRAADRELDAEITSFAEEMNARGGPRIYAEPLREHIRAARPGAGVESWLRDLRYALRMLRKAPALSLACILTFAIGVAATTVVFSMVNALVLRKLPVPHPDQLLLLSFTLHGDETAPSLSTADLNELTTQTDSAFSGVTSTTLAMIGVSSHGQSLMALGGLVSGNFFSVMGVRPALGQFFSRDSTAAVVLSHAYWSSRFHANPTVVGQSAIIEGRPVTIIGVAPRHFHGISSLIDMQVFVPVGLAPPPGSGGFPVVGIPVLRLRPGATRAAADAELVAFTRRLAAQHPQQFHDLVPHLWPMATGMVSSDSANPFRVVSALFLGLAVLVLLLAAANIMGVLLARAATRQREMALRSALGAGRARLARQVFLESLVLAAGGGALGVLLAVIAANQLIRVPPQTSFPLVLNFGVDARVLLFAAGMALLMSLVAGLVPAWRAASADPNHSLRGPAAGSAVRRRQRLRSALVAVQVAASLMLLIIGGLFLRSLLHAQRRPLGFQPAQVWNFVLDVQGANYTTVQGQQFYRRLLPAARALPGIESASLAASYPFGLNHYGGSAHPLGDKSRGSGVTLNLVSPGYFANLRMRILQGRAITAADTAHSTRVAVISASLARQLWPGQSPLGRRLMLVGSDAEPVTVVGVVGDAIYDFTDPSPQIYFALAQDYRSRQVLQVRADAATPVPEVEALLRQLAPAVPLGAVQSMHAAAGSLNGLYLFHLGARLAAALGLLGLFLAVIGVYGVVAYAAAQRTHEIGVRVALGARPRQVLAAVLRSAGAIITTGLVLGLLAAAAIGRLAGAFLVGVSGLDPLAFIAATVLLAVFALAASLIPALRASRADPLATLRCE